MPTDPDRPAKPEPVAKPLGTVIYHGTAKADDPIYQAGWNFASGKRLSPAWIKKPKPPGT